MKATIEKQVKMHLLCFCKTVDGPLIGSLMKVLRDFCLMVIVDTVDRGLGEIMMNYVF